MKDNENLQDKILSEVTRKHIPVTLYTTNGFQMNGLILNHDKYVVVMETEGKTSMIYKHAISTIKSIKPLKDLVVQ